MTPAQRHDENPERHAGRSQGQNERRENFAAALPSMFSQRATMPMSRAVSSAWIRTPSSKLRLNRSRNATTMVSPGWTGPIRSRQPRAIHGAAAPRFLAWKGRPCVANSLHVDEASRHGPNGRGCD